MRLCRSRLLIRSMFMSVPFLLAVIVKPADFEVLQDHLRHVVLGLAGEDDDLTGVAHVVGMDVDRLAVAQGFDVVVAETKDDHRPLGLGVVPQHPDHWLPPLVLESSKSRWSFSSVSLIWSRDAFNTFICLVASSRMSAMRSN